FFVVVTAATALYALSLHDAPPIWVGGPNGIRVAGRAMSALLNKSAASRRRRSSIRTRVLAIAFIPSLVFLLTGVAMAGYLIYDADRKSTRLNSSHVKISYAVFCLK